MAAANAGLARWRERMRAAKAAGLITKFPCGRKPGPSRKQREREAEEREEALARRRVEFMDAHERPRWPTRRGGSRLVMAMERVERTFIARLSDRDPPSSELIEKVLDDILQGEERYGRAEGKEERLACLSWAIDTYRDRQAIKEVLAELAQQREARAAQTSAPASDVNETATTVDQPPTDLTAQDTLVEPLAHDDDAEAAALARLTSEATELIAVIKTRLTHSGWPIFDAELDRARHLAKIKAASEGVEVTEQALRVAEINACRHKLEMIRASEAGMEAIKARLSLWLFAAEAERARELERGVPSALPGVHPRYRLP